MCGGGVRLEVRRRRVRGGGGGRVTGKGGWGGGVGGVKVIGVRGEMGLGYGVGDEWVRVNL